MLILYWDLYHAEANTSPLTSKIILVVLVLVLIFVTDFFFLWLFVFCLLWGRLVIILNGIHTWTLSFMTFHAYILLLTSHPWTIIIRTQKNWNSIKWANMVVICGKGDKADICCSIITLSVEKLLKILWSTYFPKHFLFEEGYCSLLSSAFVW